VDAAAALSFSELRRFVADGRFAAVGVRALAERAPRHVRLHAALDAAGLRLELDASHREFGDVYSSRSVAAGRAFVRRGAPAPEAAVAAARRARALIRSARALAAGDAAARAALDSMELELARHDPADAAFLEAGAGSKLNVTARFLWLCRLDRLIRAERLAGVDLGAGACAQWVAGELDEDLDAVVDALRAVEAAAAAAAPVPPV
jgi:hypothetical protein